MNEREEGRKEKRMGKMKEERMEEKEGRKGGQREEYGVKAKGRE